METAMSCFMMDYRIEYAQIAAMVSKIPAAVQRGGKQQIGSSTFHLPFLHRSGRDFYALAKPETYEMVATGINRVLLKENSECLSLGILAGLRMEQNALNEASDALLRARGALNGEISHEIGYAILLGQAETALLKGDRDAYGFHLNEARDYVETNGAHYLKQNLLAYETRLGLLDGDKKMAEGWLGNYYVNDLGLKSLYKVYQSITTARAYIVLGQLEAALDALQAVKSMADTMDRPLDGTEADVLISVIEWAAGKKKEAADRLYKRIAFLREYGFIRVVANEGKAVLPILSAVARKLVKEADRDDAADRFVKEMYVTAYEQSKRFKGITNILEPKAVKLSKQQTLVLDYLSKGYKNAEIVEHTRLSLNTVRYHTKLAYQKLEVTNAMDAIVRARQLGLLK
jgi:LuxR family maltose regulon positive regulatory protein